MKQELRKASFGELERIFQDCHDILWEGGKRDPTIAFDDFTKLLLVKIHDEKFTHETDEYIFQIKNGENISSVVTRIKNAYKKIQTKNPSIFKSEIDLSNNVIYQIVKSIQEISFEKTDADAKGKAFEDFLGKTFRDQYGQYFTPRTIVEFVVNFLNPDEKDTLIDPACGSGGFLIHSLSHVLNKIHHDKTNNQKKIQQKEMTFVSEKVFGVEINDRIARVAMMDMILHGDGHNHIFCNNSLADLETFDDKNIHESNFSLILTNPPFGSQVSDDIILNNFELSKNKRSQKTEILFIERCLKLLKNGGRLGIVLPDSILNTTTLQYVRDYIIQHSKILAVISLPHHTFVPSGAGVKPSLLFLEKSIPSKNNYQVFMGVAKHVGYDARRKPDKNDLNDILSDWNSFTSNKEIKSEKSFIISSEKLSMNFSPDQFISNSNHAEWNSKSLSELTDGNVFAGRTPPRIAYTKSGHKIMKVRDLSDNGIEWNHTERGFVSEEAYNKQKHLQLKINDILFISAAHHPKYIGEKVDIISNIPKKYENGVLCVAELIVVRVNPKYIDPYYVLLYLKSDEGYKSIQSCIRGGAHIYSKDVKDIKIPIPPSHKLKEINQHLQKIKDILKKKMVLEEEFVDTIKKFKEIMQN